ncbi:MAG: 2-oxoacid:acceptor oxidoreductase family protein [Anaerolineae bacterium]
MAKQETPKRKPAAPRPQFEARLSGEGGQGVIMGGAILAEAAILHEGRYAVQSPTYGSRVRGGPTKVDVIISNDEIIYPRATAINFFLSLAQKSFDKFCADLAGDAIILVDKNLVRNVPQNGRRVYRIPFVELAKNELGNVVLSNIIALAVIVELTGVVSREALWQSIRSHVPPKYVELNRQAMELGFKLGANLTRQKAKHQ